MNKPKLVSRDEFVKLVETKLFNIKQILTNPNVSLMGREFAVKDARDSIINEYDIHTGFASTSVEDVEEMIPEDLLFTQGRRAPKKKK